MVDRTDVGTAADGTRNDKYCSSCYRAGVFSKAASTREDATARLADYLKRAVHVPEAEADRRAEDAFAILSGAGGAALMAFGGPGALVGNWWIFALRGVLAIIFGILALIQPLAALTALVLVFGVWAFIDGITALALAISGWRSWQLVLVGLVGIGVGVLTFFRPGITAIGLYAIVAAWSVARGILEIVVAIELRRTIKGEVWLVLGGIASILFGVLMIALPAAGLLALAWLIGAYALTFGVIMCALSIRLRRLRREVTPRKVPIGVPTPQPT
jgi:uncharacterized membrane protein HdeD (DUF308 family)